MSTNGAVHTRWRIIAHSTMRAASDAMRFCTSPAIPRLTAASPLPVPSAERAAAARVHAMRISPQQALLALAAIAKGRKQRRRHAAPAPGISSGSMRSDLCAQAVRVAVRRGQGARLGRAGGRAGGAHSRG